MNERGGVVDAFDREAATYRSRYTGEGVEAHSFVARRRRVVELLRRGPVGTMLDVGCGPGVMVGHVRRDGWRYVGVDPAAAMLRESQAVFGDLAVVQARVEALPFLPSGFDAVLAMGVLEYLDDPQAALEELCRVTKPGGRLIVTMPNRLSPYRLWTRSLYRPATAMVKALLGRSSASGLRRREFVAAAWSRRLTAAGMTVTDVVYYGFNVLLSPLDKLLPGAAARVANALEPVGRSAAGVLGTGFILAARKPAPHPQPRQP